jgi:hypothetical protein
MEIRCITDYPPGALEEIATYLRENKERIPPGYYPRVYKLELRSVVASESKGGIRRNQYPCLIADGKLVVSGVGGIKSYMAKIIDEAASQTPQINPYNLQQPVNHYSAPQIPQGPIDQRAAQNMLLSHGRQGTVSRQNTPSHGVQGQNVSPEHMLVGMRGGASEHGVQRSRVDPSTITGKYYHASMKHNPNAEYDPSSVLDDDIDRTVVAGMYRDDRFTGN